MAVSGLKQNNISRTAIIFVPLCKHPHFILVPLPVLKSDIHNISNYSKDHFQRQLILTCLAQQNQMPEPGFDNDWAILIVSGHGDIGHLDVFSDDPQALEGYADKPIPELFPVQYEFGVSLKEFLTWLDDRAETLLKTLDPAPPDRRNKRYARHCHRTL